MYLAFDWSSAGTWKANTSAKGSTSTLTVTSRPVHQQFGSFGGIRFVFIVKVIWTNVRKEKIREWSCFCIVIWVRDLYKVTFQVPSAGGMSCNFLVTIICFPMENLIHISIYVVIFPLCIERCVIMSHSFASLIFHCAFISFSSVY